MYSICLNGACASNHKKISEAKQEFKRYVTESQNPLSDFCGKSVTLTSGFEKYMSYDPPEKVFSIIVAVNNKHAIGKDNDIPWHCSEDLKNFKEITTGHTILMGRRTYESIGKPLPHRQNIVLSSDKSFKPEGVIVYSSVDEFLENNDDDEVMICGGARVYDEFMDRGLANRIYLSKIPDDSDGDTFFPIDRFFDWNLVHKEDKKTFTWYIYGKNEQ